jgi:hypothetical protein
LYLLLVLANLLGRSRPGTLSLAEEEVGHSVTFNKLVGVVILPYPWLKRLRVVFYGEKPLNLLHACFE